MAHSLTTREVHILIIIERSTASLSVFATLILLSTFVFLKEFRTLSNTLIFYASFANLGANIAALIGGSALSNEHSGLCQFQGFLLEMFMQSDPMWSLAMAVNVYLVFFRRYDAHRLRKLYWVYALLCYGIPFIPAMVCLLLKVNGKKQIYGNATLWCWIDNDWQILRIYSYYAPVWFCILAALVIYTFVGVEIFKKRTELRAAANAVSTSENYASVSSPMSPLPQSTTPFSGLRTTEIEVTHDPWLKTEHSFPSTPAQAYGANAQGKKTPKDNYSITISAPRSTKLLKRHGSMDRIKWAYTKTAMLFAISILITWVPASINRIYGIANPTTPSFGLNIASAIVLPLQGFWNTVIYFVTSGNVCCVVWDRWTKYRSRDEVDSLRRLDTRDGKRVGKGDTDSTVELSHTRSRSEASPDGSMKSEF